MNTYFFWIWNEADYTRLETEYNEVINQKAQFSATDLYLKSISTLWSSLHWKKLESQYECI